MARRVQDRSIQERQRRKRKKRKQRLYRFLVLILTIAILILVALILFRIQKINVKGNEYTPDKEIIQMIQSDKYSVNSLYVLGKYRLGKGKVLPCLESVHVSLSSPWILEVSVKEKAVAGYLKNGGENLCFDKEGLVVAAGTQKIEGVPLVEGIQAERMELYQKLGGKNTKIYGEIYETASALEKYDLVPEKIVCKDDRVYLYIKNVCISLGSSVTSEKIAQIPPIMDKLGDRAGTLHLENYVEGTETVTFEREKKDTGEDAEESDTDSDGSTDEDTLEDDTAEEDLEDGSGGEDEDSLDDTEEESSDLE